MYWACQWNAAKPIRSDSWTNSQKATETTSEAMLYGPNVGLTQCWLIKCQGASLSEVDFVAVLLSLILVARGAFCLSWNWQLVLQLNKIYVAAAAETIRSWYVLMPLYIYYTCYSPWLAFVLALICQQLPANDLSCQLCVCVMSTCFFKSLLCFEFFLCQIVILEDIY